MRDKSSLNSHIKSSPIFAIVSQQHSVYFALVYLTSLVYFLLNTKLWKINCLQELNIIW